MLNQFARFEEDFASWRRDGMPGLKAESYEYVEFLTCKDDDRLPREALSVIDPGLRAIRTDRIEGEGGRGGYQPARSTHCQACQAKA